MTTKINDRGTNKFCVICRQKVSTNMFVNFITRVKLYEFDNGTYCEKCATIIVAKRRAGGLRVYGK